MEKISAKDQQIFEDMKKCVEDLGLKILNEDMIDGNLCGFSTFEYPAYNIGIGFIFDPRQNAADLSIRYADIPVEKIPALYELLNHINMNMIMSHFSIAPEMQMVLLRTGHYVTGYFLNRGEFKMVLGQMLGLSHTYFPLIGKLMLTDQTPQAIMKEFYESNGIISPGTLGSAEKAKESKVAKEQPFIIHGSADMPAFPTHSHGMTELGMPEFLIDHLAFGVEQNGGRISASYKYFMKPENADKLDAIKNGETVKLRDADLKPDAKTDSIVYCYRRVYPEFEMVKQAYVIEDPKDVDPKTWFIQIYVEGDDFALTDDYYKGGIKW